MRCITSAVPLVAIWMTLVTPAFSEITDREVRQSIQRGVEFLKSRQDKKNGSWPEHPVQPGGLSALCTLALINSGVGLNDPSVQKALDYLRSFDKPEMTYSVALRTMVLCAGDPKKDLLVIRRNVKWLEAIQLRNGNRKGAWGYSSRRGNGDNSNTQFALLALNEAARVGVEVSEATWRLALDYWKRTQMDNGAWGYYEGQPPTGSMTCAGISSMVIASGRLTSGHSSINGDQVLCCGGGGDNEKVERALVWLGNKFSVRANPNDRMWLLYYLYGVERVGRLTGRRFIGKHDWYREGAEMLVREQDDFSGYWRGTGATESNPLVGTSLALLFLSKGRRPVVVSKVKYAGGSDWDNHAGGIPNLVRTVEMSWERELTWQTIDLRMATVEDLLESPVLFLSGKESLNLNREQIENLRAYVKQGGFIFAEACDGNGCNGKAFDRTFRDLMKRMFPDSPLRLLPSDHPVWFAEAKVNADYMSPLYGIDACCRTSIVYCPQNLSCFWELSVPGREVEAAEKVRNEIEACVRTGQNVIAYATNRVLKQKLDRPDMALADNGEPDIAHGVLMIPKLGHNGGSDDAPNSLANLLRFVRQKVEVRTNGEHLVLPATSGSLYEYPIVFVHGRRDFRWTAAERKALADFLANGGFVFADSICASPEFAQAFRREMSAILPGERVERIPPHHPLFSTEYGGFDLSRVTLNDPKLRRDDDRLETRQTKITPLLEGIQYDGRLAVVFSPYDISCALESSASLDCKGYVRTDAAKIGTNIILFALQQ